MSSLSPQCKQDHPVQLLCAHRAQNTYEVSIARGPEGRDFSVVNIWPDTEAIRLHAERELRWPSGSVINVAVPAISGADVEKPLCLLHDREAQTPRHGPSQSSFHFDARRGQYRTTEHEHRPEEQHPHVKTLKTARQKLIEFLKKDEFFEEHSFLALLTLLLAHMFRLVVAVFEMGCNAPAIFNVFLCVWRFMQNKVEDILATEGGPRVGLKCTIFSVELLVIFFCIFVFLWTVFIPVCNSLFGIVSKIMYLFP